MLITNPSVKFEMINEKSESFDFSSQCNQSFADISLLKNNFNDFFDFMTLELNKSILDSSMQTIDETLLFNNIPFMSNKLSDSNCQFSDVLVSSIKTNGNARFYALSLNFGDNPFDEYNTYPKKIRVEYVSDNPENNRESIIDNISDSSIIVYMSGESIKRVNIYFLESWFPFRFAHLHGVNFGVTYYWDNNDITDLIVTEETPYFCNTLPIDTSKLTIYSDDKFSISSDKSIRSYINDDTKITISASIRTTEDDEYRTNIQFGEYYIDNIKYESENRVTFDLSTILRRLDKYKFISTEMYEGGPNDNSYNLIYNIFHTTNIDLSKVYVDDSLRYVYLTGYLPVMSCREALQRVLLISDAMLYDNRSLGIKIVMHPQKVSQVIDSNEIFDPVNKEEDINILKINYDLYNYDISSSSEKIATLDLDPGKIQTVMFPNPVDPDTIESDIGLQVIESGVLYSKVGSIIGNNHTIEAKIYKESKFNNETQTSRNTDIKNISINDLKLKSQNINNIIQNIADFNSESTVYKIEYVCTGQETGKYTKFNLSKPVNFITSNGEQFKTSDGKILQVQSDQKTGYLRYQSIDLAHGMVTKAEIILQN
jgi:hypothetical protein